MLGIFGKHAVFHQTIVRCYILIEQEGKHNLFIAPLRRHSNRVIQGIRRPGAETIPVKGLLTTVYIQFTLATVSTKNKVQILKTRLYSK